MNLPQSIYVHIPFCKRRCFYCDFAITTGGASLVTRYLTVLQQEINLMAANLSCNHPVIETLFLGGGTPSLLATAEIDQIIQGIAAVWQFSPTIEISLEANPGTLSVEKAYAYGKNGVNRISLGVQAFQDGLLEVCGRDHKVTEIHEAIHAIKMAKISNFSLDLIAGLPQQTLTDWQESLEQTIAAQPTHVSVYDLTIEPGTAFGKRYQPGILPLPPESLTVKMFYLAHQLLITAGYEHYEISNYCLPGYGCRHNLTYWHNQPFYGIGMGATSYVDYRRWDRPRKMAEYCQTITTWQHLGTPPPIPIVPPAERLFDTLMQGLRLAEGIAIAPLYTIYGAALVDKVLALLVPYIDRGWVTQDNFLRLAPLEGWIFSDVIIADLYNLLLKTAA